jgi:hypothetical protein
MAMDKENIELIELTTVDHMPSMRHDNPAPRGACWKVVLAFKDGYGNQLLTGTWYISKKEVPDSSVLAIARSYLHNSCKALAEATPDWSLNQEQYDALKRSPKPQSSNPASLASQLPH